MKNISTKSSGNVFLELGFEPPEAAVLPRVSDLAHGKWEQFSLELLITLEARLGRTVRLEPAA